MRQRIESEPAYVLARRPYRETSLLIEAFSEHYGRIGLVARGARGGRPKSGAALQAFVPLLLSWNESGDLGTLVASEAAGSPVMLAGERIFHGWYLNELLLRLLNRHDAHPELYAVYAYTLPQLAAGDSEPLLRAFELRLLGEIGYGIELPQDIDAGARYHYDAEAGLRRAEMRVGTDAFSGAALIALRDGTLASVGTALRREARKLLRLALRCQLGGRELETPRLLRELRAGVAPRANESQSEDPEHSDG
jgi:DNA repair protein RecO (recombination protein O)